MRIAELSRTTGVPIATIKYYRREGLLPPGERTSPNQAQYADVHVRRLRLVRALIEVGGLSVAAVRDVLEAVDSPEQPVHHILGTVQQGMARPSEEPLPDDVIAQVEAFIDRQAWRVKPENPGIRTLAAVVATMRRLGGDFEDVLDVYAHACRQIADAEIGYVSRVDGLEEMIERMVVGSVFGEVALSAIRQLAQEDASARRLGG